MSTLNKDLLALVAMFKKDEPADPTVNMSPEDAAKWKAMNEEHGDKFKTAAYGDPYWMTAKYPGKAQDGTPVKKGDKVFYYPRTKTLLVGPKAEAAAREFGAMSFDDDFGFRAAGFSYEVDSAWFAFVGNAAFNKDTIDAIHRLYDIPFKDDEGTLHDEGGVAPKVVRKEYSGPLTYAQEKAGQVRETVVQIEFVKGMDKKKILQALQEVGKKFKLKVEPMTGYKKPETRGKKAQEMSDLSFLATLDMELTASALPGVGLDKDAAALESLAKLAHLDRTANRMVAETILDQMGGSRRLQVMLGVKMFNILSTGNPGVGIQWPNKQRSKGNYVEIRLNGGDLYDMKFFNMGGTAPMKLVKAYDDVYAEDLKDIFERQTGWYLRMASDQAHQLVQAHEAGDKTAGDRLFRFTEGTMTEKEWVQQYAVRVEAVKVSWESLIDRRKYNRMDGDEQKRYEASLKKKAEIPQYRAWKDNDIFVVVSKETYLWAQKTGIGKKADLENGVLAEGCPDNLDESECAEWEANTEKYEDKFKTAGVTVKSIKPEDVKKADPTIIGTIDVDGTVVEVVRGPSGSLTTRGKGGKKVSPAESSAAIAAFKEEFPKTTWGRKKADLENGVLAEGCPDNLDESECAEWEANTEKYKDVVKDRAKEASFLTTTLSSSGEEVLAKMYQGDLTPVSYANRTQAYAAQEKLGPDWDVIQRGRPWYLRKVNARTAAKLVPIEDAKKGDLVEVTYKGEKVTGTVVRIKSDGLVTVDVEKTKSNPGGHSDEDVSHIDIRVKKTAYEEGSRVPDGWDNGQIEGEEHTDELGDEGSQIPDGNGNQAKRAGKKPTPAEKAEAKKLFDKWRADADGAEMDDLDESWQNFLDGDLSLKDLKKYPPTKEASAKQAAEVIEEMYALVSDDGYMLGATDDWHDARSKSYWRPFVDEDHVAEGKLMTLANVPLHLAEKFKDMGTPAQMFNDGYDAWAAARRFAKGSGTKLASAEKEAAGGLYGHTKRIQADCEGCVRKVQKTAQNIARNVYARNAEVADFLATHAKRADSLPAKLLVSALQGMGPKVASEIAAAETRESRLTELRTQRAASKSLAHNTILTRLASVSEVALADISGTHMAKLLEAAEDLQKMGFVTFDGVTVAKVTDGDAQTGEGIKQTTDKNASQGPFSVGTPVWANQGGLEGTAGIVRGVQGDRTEVEALWIPEYLGAIPAHHPGGGSLDPWNNRAKGKIQLIPTRNLSSDTKAWETWFKHEYNDGFEGGSFPKNASGSTNAKYLDNLAPPMKDKILRAVAKHYEVSVAEIEAEMKDPDAEALYEYLAFDRSLALMVHSDFKKMRLASGPCLEGHAVALLQRISQTAYHDDLRSLFEKELGIPTREFSEHLMALDMAKMISLQKASGPKGKTILVYRPTPAGLAYLADAKAGKTAARTYGLYGYGEKVVKLGLQACADLRHEAGKTAHDLHSRRTAHHAAINDFFAQHGKQAKCMYSKLLAASYPELKEAKTASLPNSVQGWLEWGV